MKQGGWHQTRTLVVPSWDPNKLLVSRGSEGNADKATIEPSTGRSIIKFWNIDEFTGSPVQFSSTGTILGMGLRNSVGVGEDPTTGGIVGPSPIPRNPHSKITARYVFFFVLLTQRMQWSVENSVDGMVRLGQDIHKDNPGEELNYHGRINATEPNDKEGLNYGYPVCYAVWDTSTVRGIDGVRVGMQITGGLPSDEYTDAWCAANTEEPRLTFAAHTAPLDIKFRRNGSAAFISFHGSW